MGQGREACLAQLGFIQPAVEGPVGLVQAVFLRGDGDDLGGFCRLTENLAGKFVPADIAALIGGVVIAVLLRFQHIHQQPGQVGGVGRRAHLIVDHPDGVVFFAETQHGFDKVLPVPSEYPSGTDNEILVQRIAHRQFPVQLGLAVNIQRVIVLTIRLPGGLALAVEHIVRRQVQHFATHFFAGIRKIPGAVHIDFVHQPTILRILRRVQPAQ